MAIVTGGSRGVGREVVRILAGVGDAVVVNYVHDQRAADATVEEILCATGIALAIRADVADELDVERLFNETTEAFGGVDVVVHTAAQMACGPVTCPVRREAARRLRDGGAVVGFSGLWQPEIPADVARFVAFLTAPPGIDQGLPRVRRAAESASVLPATQPTEVNMSTADVSSTPSTRASNTGTVDMKLEVVVLPVSDVDRTKRFYQDLGWRLDADLVTGEDFRVVQLTPPGSQASIIFGTGLTSAAPGSTESLVLAVYDIDTARDELISHGVNVSEVFHDEGGVFHHAGTTGRVAGPDPVRRSYASWASFSDPDGNGWLLQEIVTRLPGR